MELMSQYLVAQISPDENKAVDQGHSHICKSAWVVGNVSSTCRNTSLGCAATTPGISSPVTTECNIENDLLVDKVRIEVAALLEIRGRFTPGMWSRRTGRDICRNGTTLEEPDPDIVGGPLHGIDTTVVGVEIETVALGIRARNAASCAIGTCVHIVCAIVGLESSRLVVACN